MNKRDMKELVALKAVELFSFMNVVCYDESESISVKHLNELKQAVDLWNPSSVEVEQVKVRIARKQK